MGSKVDCKVVVLGKAYAGKTCLISQFIHQKFYANKIPYKATIGAAFGAKRIDVNGESIMLGIWDTAGSERYEAMSRIYYRGARAAIVCYDLTDQDSWSRTQFWVNELRENEENCKIYLCGTKKDLVDEDGKHMRKVDKHTATDYGEEINAPVFETSSKTGQNIRELFDRIAEDFVKDPQTRMEMLENTITPTEDRPRRGGCCR